MFSKRNPRLKQILSHRRKPRNRCTRRTCLRVLNLIRSYAPSIVEGRVPNDKAYTRPWLRKRSKKERRLRSISAASTLESRWTRMMSSRDSNLKLTNAILKRTGLSSSGSKCISRGSFLGKLVIGASTVSAKTLSADNQWTVSNSSWTLLLRAAVSIIPEWWPEISLWTAVTQ